LAGRTSISSDGNNRGIAARYFPQTQISLQVYEQQDEMISSSNYDGSNHFLSHALSKQTAEARRWRQEAERLQSELSAIQVKKDEHESISLDISKMQKLQAENDELRHKLESSNLMISVENKANRSSNQIIADLKRKIVELETENLTLSYTKNHLKEELQTVKAEKRNVESENSVLKEKVKFVP